MKRTLLILTIISAVTFYSCKDDEETPPVIDDTPTVSFCDSVKATYTKDVKSVVDASCAGGGCHEDKASAPKGIKLATYAQVKAAAESGGFMKVIKHEAGVAPMPSGQPKLDDNTIKVLDCWISGGLKEN
jgi:hypothetical protein